MRPLFATAADREQARKRLLTLIREQSLSFGSFRLASGASSHFYLDLRRTTTHPEGAHLVATLLLDRLTAAWPDGAGGPTLGADPIVGALAALSHHHGRPLPTFIVRRAVKDHGLQRPIEGHLQEGNRVVLLDDVITRGGSLIEAARVVRGQGAEISHVLTVLDREAGGREALQREGLAHETLLVLSDLLTAEELAGPGAEGDEAPMSPATPRRGTP
jgi:orotate phosphoribosyltransferase